MKKCLILFLAFSLFRAQMPGLCAGRAFASSADARMITLDVKNMELADVIRMIADQSGLNIVSSQNVRGQVSVSLQNVPVERALDAILRVNNCTYVKEGEIIQVYTLPEYKQMEQFARMTTRVFELKYVKAADLKPLLLTLKSAKGKIEAEPKTNRIVATDTEESLQSMAQTILEMDRKVDTKVFKLSYADPGEVQKNLKEVIPETDGEVLLDERTNSLVVSAPPLLMDKIEIIVDNWDRKIPQVLIEAKIMQLTVDKDRFLGVDWTFTNPTKNSLTVGAPSFPLPTGAAYVEAFKIGVLGQNDYEATIRALENTSDANLISSPSIVTLDGEEAKILIGSSEPYEVLHFDDEGNVTSQEVKFIDVGIKLEVTPKVSKDGYITMDIHPEVSSPRQGTVTTSQLAIDTTEADAVMTVKDGNTLVMGGLIKDDQEKVVTKVPFLGDIPLLGLLFRQKYNTTVKKEIVIFITPRLMNCDTDMSREMAEKSALAGGSEKKEQ